MRVPEKQPQSLRGKVGYLLIIVVIIQSAYPITMGNSVAALIGYQLAYLLLIVAGVLIAGRKPFYTWALTITGILWAITGAIFAFNQEAQWANLAGYIIIAVYFILVVVVLLEFIFTTRSVTSDVLYAAVTVYFMLGAIFVPLYGLVETLTWFPEELEHAFVDGSNPTISEPFQWQTFIYFSYATLTTLGYGDVLPVSPWARSLTSLESITGVLYTTIILARLVGLYASRDVEAHMAEEGYLEKPPPTHQGEE